MTWSLKAGAFLPALRWRPRAQWKSISKVWPRLGRSSSPSASLRICVRQCLVRATPYATVTIISSCALPIGTFARRAQNVAKRSHVDALSQTFAGQMISSSMPRVVDDGAVDGGYDAGGQAARLVLGAKDNPPLLLPIMIYSHPAFGTDRWPVAFQK